MYRSWAFVISPPRIPIISGSCPPLPFTPSVHLDSALGTSGNPHNATPDIAPTSPITTWKPTLTYAITGPPSQTLLFESPTECSNNKPRLHQCYFSLAAKLDHLVLLGMPRALGTSPRPSILARGLVTKPIEIQPAKPCCLHTVWLLL